jgi:folate-dependent tRNA-U54 methylase TrmFO/GidA
MNVTFGLIEDTSHSPIRDKSARRRMMVERALRAIEDWKRDIEARQELRLPPAAFRLPTSC